MIRFHVSQTLSFIPVAIYNRVKRFGFDVRSSPLQSAPMDFFCLKSEWIDEECFESFQAAKERIDQIVILYNSLRPHASCDWLTPLEAELRTGKLKHHWGRKTVVRKAYVNLYQDNIF